MDNKKNIIVLTGAGQLGMAMVRRVAYGNKIIIADWKIENAKAIAKTLQEAGFDTMPFIVDISSRQSILKLIEVAQNEGEIAMLINSAGLSPSQSTKEHILAVDLYGTAVLLEEFGKVIKKGGAGVTISSQSGYRMPGLTADEDRLLATTPTEELL